MNTILAAAGFNLIKMLGGLIPNQNLFLKFLKTLY